MSDIPVPKQNMPFSKRVYGMLFFKQLPKNAYQFVFIEIPVYCPY